MNQIRYVLLVVTVVALVGVSALALDVPNTFASGEVISAAEMNANFAAVEAAVTALQASQPVMAHGTSAVAMVMVTSTTEAEDVVTVTLQAPAAGVVLVQATAQAAWDGTTSANYMEFQIDTEAGGSLTSGEFVVGEQSPANTARVWSPVAIQRAFEVDAGSHTFRLEALDVTGDGFKYFWKPTITAVWYPAGSADIQPAGFVPSGAAGGNLP